MKKMNLLNQRFGKLTVIKDLGSFELKSGRKQIRWLSETEIKEQVYNILESVTTTGVA